MDHDRDRLDGEDLVDLCEAPSEFAARSLVIVLEDAGIRAVTFGAGELPNVPSLTTGQGRGVAVQVARRDLEAARQMLDDLPRRAEAIDWDAIDVGEPSPEEVAVTEAAMARPPSPALVRGLLVLGAIGLTLAIVGFLIELSRRTP